MEQHISQEKVRRIINDMAKKRNSIVPVIGEDTIVYTYGMPFVLRWLSDRPFMWSRIAFVESSKVMRRYTQVTDMNSQD